MDALSEYYEYMLPDHRLDDYPMMTKPWIMLIVVLLYLYATYYFLPSYMAKRKPYNLKTTLKLYNIFQIVASGMAAYCIATAGWTTHYSIIGCYDIGPPEDEMAMRMAGRLWWAWIIRIAELMETVLFILRKKSNQVSFLHVYHHANNVFLGWVFLRSFPGGMFTFTVLQNSIIHVVMYTYYLLSSLGPVMQRKLAVVKNKVTILQLIQFVIALLHTSQAYFFNCKLTIPPPVANILACHLLILLVLFLHFYLKTFVKPKNQ